MSMTTPCTEGKAGSTGYETSFHRVRKSKVCETRSMVHPLMIRVKYERVGDVNGSLGVLLS